MKRIIVIVAVLLCLMVANATQATDFNSSRPYPRFQVGISGILATFEPGAVLTVDGAIPDSPAEGKVEKGDVILSAGGRAIEGKDPRRPLGEALLEAEAKDGRFVLQIKRGDKQQEVVVNVPSLGPYSPTWPIDCKKSRAIVKQTADKLVRSQQEDGSFLVGRNRVSGSLTGCMAALFLLSTDDAAYMPAVRHFVNKLAADVQKNPTGSSWHLGYQLILMAEYYLKTGDRTMLPAMNVLAAKTADGLIAGSWGHSMTDTSVGYVQSGQMNSAGVTVFLGLALARECGVTVSDKTFDTSMHFFYRMPGHGSICYGDHRSEIYVDTNGRNAAIGCAMALLPGNAYQASAQHMAMLIADSYCAPEAGHTGGGFNVLWRGIGTMHLPKDQQHRYRRHMDELDWFYNLCRLPGGGFKMLPSAPSCATRYTSEEWGYGLGLTYTAPLHTLRITGAPPTRHSVRRPLPERPWGTERDLVFLQSDYCDGYGKEDEPPHVIYDQVHRRNADPSVAYCAKQMRHFSPMIRTWAAYKLAAKNTDESNQAIAEALQHPDPRVRRAGCDAISSYTNWGRGRRTLHMPTSVVSEMFVPHIEKMLGDPDAAFWEIDGALWALGFGSAEDIRRNMPTIRKFAVHPEWYLRESAYWAVVGLGPKMDGEEFLFLADMYLKSRHVFERSSYDAGINYLLRSARLELDDETIAAYVKRIGATTHSALLAGGYDEKAAHHEAVHRTMMVLARFKNAPYQVILPDLVKYIETWEPGYQHSNWLILGNGWQPGLVKVAELLGPDAKPLIDAFRKCLDRIEWNERDRNHTACREAIQKAIADFESR